VTALSYQKAPWKHPAVWPAHLIHTEMACSEIDGASIVTVICECAWSVCAKADRRGAHFVALDDAKEDHWQAIIAEAESVAA
jgi:hypothetical protein